MKNTLAIALMSFTMVACGGGGGGVTHIPLTDHTARAVPCSVGSATHYCNVSAVNAHIEPGTENSPPPIHCTKEGTLYWCNPQGATVSIEHNAMNSEHVLQGRATLVDSVVRAVGSGDLMGLPADFTAVCELRPGVFTSSC